MDPCRRRRESGCRHDDCTLHTRSPGQPLPCGLWQAEGPNGQIGDGPSPTRIIGMPAPDGLSVPRTVEQHEDLRVVSAIDFRLPVGDHQIGWPREIEHYKAEIWGHFHRCCLRRTTRLRAAPCSALSEVREGSACGQPGAGSPPSIARLRTGAANPKHFGRASPLRAGAYRGGDGMAFRTGPVAGLTGWLAAPPAHGSAIDSLALRPEQPNPAPLSPQMGIPNALGPVPAL